MEGLMRLKAMAKINLGLDVLGKREDGYHEVRMIMQTIRMYDILDIRKNQTAGDRTDDQSSVYPHRSEKSCI